MGEEEKHNYSELFETVLFIKKFKHDWETRHAAVVKHFGLHAVDDIVSEIFGKIDDELRREREKVAEPGTEKKD